MKRYDKYKPSLNEFTYEIPHSWTVSRLKYVGYLYSGLTGKNGDDFKSENNSNNKPFIPFTNIANNFKINPKQLEYVVMNDEEEQNKVVKNDLFFMMSSENFDDVGKSTILLDDLGEAYLNSFCKGYRVTSNHINPLFLNYLMFSDSNRKKLMIEANGFTRINLKMDKVNDFYIEFPSLEEQTSIAIYLDNKTKQIDDLINKKQKFIDLLKEEKVTLINQAVTKGLKKNIKLKPSGVELIGDIPEDWEIKKLKYVVNKIGSGVTPKGGAEIYLTEGIPLIRSQNVYFDGLRLDDVAYISEEIDNTMVGSRVYEGDVLLNITGGSIGRCYYVPKGFGRANVNQHVCIIRPSENILTEYLFFLISSNLGQEQINMLQTGANREGLNFEQLKSFSFPIPSIKIQEGLINELKAKTSNSDSVISKTEKEIELLKEYRIALINEVVTGKVNVK